MNILTGGIPPSIGNLTSLENLDVAGNKLTGLIPSSIANASSLVRLDLSSNNFKGQIPLFSNMPNLQRINLARNQLSSDGEGGMNFIASLANSSQLYVLALESNRLTGNLPSSIADLSKELSQLNMNENRLDGSLPAGISNLVGLIGLSLSGNFFNGNLPPSIGEMSILQKLHLNNNNFSGRIPDSLGNLNQLYDLRLSENNLTGSIPTSLGNIQRLDILDLSANMLNGTIPVEIFGILSLSLVLNLSSNSLTGQLPQDFGSLSTIQAIDLSQNQLSGVIPNLRGIPSLFILDLSENFFHGGIPDSLQTSKSIETLDISSNNLSGGIPSFLQDFEFIKRLNLSKNQLEGEVPTEGIFANSSLVSLGGNQNLCGGVPELNLPKCIFPGKNSGRDKVKLVMKITAATVAYGIYVYLCWKNYICSFCTKLNVRSYSRRRLTYITEASDDVFPIEGEYILYTYHDLRTATANFHVNNRIGEGNFGCVYKGILNDGTSTAIKVFDMENPEALESFVSECQILRNVRHRNIVRVLSACSSPEFKALMLPFMSNGSLNDWLYGSSFELGVRLKVKIAKDIADALEYLHHDSEISVVHCDLKPSNVLLDQQMIAYVGDFGVSKFLNKVSKQYPVNRALEIQGTIGYIAPEYGLGAQVSREGDVYSYGILLLEMFTGKKPTSKMFTGGLNLQKWVERAVTDGITDIIDSTSLHEGEEHCLVSLINVGLNCASNFPQDRPTMRQVSSMILNIRHDLLQHRTL